MIGKNRLGLALFVAAAATMAIAFAASSASATVVKPANTKVTGELQVGERSRLLPKNAYAEVFLSCKKSKTEFTVPSETAQPTGMKQNTNRGQKAGESELGEGEHVGTFSQSPGAVSMQLQEQNKAAGFEGPSFEECSVRKASPEKPHEEGTEIAAATVTTTTGWTLAATSQPAVGKKETINLPLLAVGVPDKGAVIKFTLPGKEECVVTIGEGQQTVVTAEYSNTTHKASIDGQVKYTVNNEVACEGLGSVSPAQFEGQYLLTAAEGKSFEVLP
jgi:hypothetical protein